MPYVMPMRSTGEASRTGQNSLKRRAATVFARCAMASWAVLAAMPVIVLVCALS